MRYLLKKLYAMGIDKEQVRRLAPKTVEITKGYRRLILSKGDEGKFNVIYVLKGKSDTNISEEEVLKIIEEYK